MSFSTSQRRCETWQIGPRTPRACLRLDDLVNLAVEWVPSARWASLTVLRAKKFRTEATTDQSATKADILQYETGLRAVRRRRARVTPSTSAGTLPPTSGGWSGAPACTLSLGCAASSRSDFGSAATPGVIAGLNIYSHNADAFDEHARAVGLVLATHGGLLMNTMLANNRARNLQRALESNREIGVAIGVLMHEHRLSQEQAFDVLRAASQDSNRKLADIAIEVVDTGTLTSAAGPRTHKRDSRHRAHQAEPRSIARVWPLRLSPLFAHLVWPAGWYGVAQLPRSRPGPAAGGAGGRGWPYRSRPPCN